MDLTKELLKTQTDVSCNDYIIMMNNLSPFNVNDNLLKELLEILNNEFIDCFILKKFNIISDSTDIPLYLQKYTDIVIRDKKKNYYIDKNAFINIIINNTISLCSIYMLIIQYKLLYYDYQEKLSKLLELKANYYRLESLMSFIKNSDITLINDINTKKNNINDEINLLLS